MIYLGLCSTKRNGALLGSNLTRNNAVKRDDSHIGLALYECQPFMTVGMPSNAKKNPNIFLKKYLDITYNTGFNRHNRIVSPGFTPRPMICHAFGVVIEFRMSFGGKKSG